MNTTIEQFFWNGEEVTQQEFLILEAQQAMQIETSQAQQSEVQAGLMLDAVADMLALGFTRNAILALTGVDITATPVLPVQPNPSPRLRENMSETLERNGNVTNGTTIWLRRGSTSIGDSDDAPLVMPENAQLISLTYSLRTVVGGAGDFSIFIYRNDFTTPIEEVKFSVTTTQRTGVIDLKSSFEKGDEVAVRAQRTGGGNGNDLVVNLNYRIL